MKDVTYSTQNPFSPHKTYGSIEAFYLNVSVGQFHIVQPISMFEIFILINSILN
jgi:hypothetical protein